MDRRLERGEATRAHIVVVATGLFAEQGYEAVSIETILRVAAISRGALYHHFKSKEAVFTAALEGVEERVAAHLTKAASIAPDPLAALHLGAAAWLQLAAHDQAVRRIVLTDAPAAIGWSAWREVSSRYTLGLVRTAVGAVIGGQVAASQRVNLVAHVLMAVLIEAALLVAAKPDDVRVVQAAEDAIYSAVNGMCRP